jgi:hypothetical protein
VFSWYLLRTDKEHLVLFGYFTFMTFWAMTSCFYNDLGIFNLELYRFTETTYATAKLAGYAILFNLGFLLMVRLLMPRPMARIDYTFSRQSLKLGHFKFASYAAIALIIVYIFYTLFTEGIPLLSGMSRVEYLKQAGLLERKLIFYVSPIAFLLGFYRRKGRWFSTNGFVISIFVLFAILVGNKFSLLVTMLVSYFTPVFIRFLAANPGRRLFTRRRIFGLMVVISLFIMMTFVAYFHVFRNISYSYNLLVNRIFAFQGQMWWAVNYDVSLEGRYDEDHWQVELDNILSPGDTREGEVGMKYLMVKVLGPQKAYSIFNRGYLYTYTYPAILIATFPEGMAVFIQFLAGLIFAAILYYLYYSILYRHALRSLIAMLVIMPYLAMILSGNFATFFTLGMVIKLAILTTLELGARKHALTTEPAME